VSKQRIAACAAIVLMLCVFPASGAGGKFEYRPLVLNVDEGPRFTVCYTEPLMFRHNLTGEQIAAVLPGFEGFAAIKTATASYETDSWLNKVQVEIERPDKPNFRTNITLAKDAVRSTERYQRSLFDTLYWEAKGFTISDVHGIPVVAECVDDATSGGTYEYDTNNRIELYKFTATFPLNGIIYNITLYDDPSSIEYNECLEMLVNEIILTSVRDGMTADLSVLDNPEVPELRDERLSLEQAYADPDFGAYIPKSFPEGLAVDYAWRFISQTRNSLSIYGKPNGINIGVWTILEPTEYHFANLVSLEEREKYDVSLYPAPGWAFTVPDEFWQVFQFPIFRAEDMSLDTVMTRVHEGNVQGFGVFIDDAVVEICSYFVTPEQAWEMLEPVIAR